MKIVNCTWELENLGCRTAEVSIEKNEILDKDSIKALEKDFDYIVIKIPSCMAKAYQDVAELGYYFVENQISLAKKYKDFKIENKIVETMLDDLEVKTIEDKTDLERILNRMTPNMFSTDRIYLDPYFGPEYSLKRYRNWIRTEFAKGTTIDKIFYNNKEIGFGFNKLDDNNVLHGILGGLFEDSQSVGTGLTIMLGNYLMVNRGLKFKTFKLKVSSNNLPIIQMYNYLHFEQTAFDYVFVKHI